ncbi:MAG: NBR1-Ig-like domain-containing protein [Myxococcales bacterium]
MSARLLRLLPTVLVATALADPASAWATRFRLPLDGCDQPTQCVGTNKCYVTAYYDHEGKDWNCGSEVYDGHVGTDFGVQATVGVRAVVAGAAGTVIETNDGCGTGSWGNTCGGGFGNYVKLLHDDGKITTYGHMASGTLKVHQGDSVTCGQELGRAGNSGNSSGPHLHFEVEDPTYGIDDPYSGSCGGPLSYWVSQGSYCRLPSATCQGSCNPSCSGKSCGPDGCGSTCGTCGPSDYCSSTGQCETTPSDGATFVSETIPDGTHFKPGATFTKTWTLRNTGPTAWTKAGGYSLAFQYLEGFGAAARTWPGPTETINPNATKAWSVPMTAPLVPGTYRGYWQMEHNGYAFGDSIWVEIVVDEAEVDAATLMDETLADGTKFVAGATVTKTWTLMNAGTSTWTKAAGFQWAFLHGDLMNAAGSVDLGASEQVAPNHTRVWTVSFKAPTAPGSYRSYWGLTHAGARFGPEVWLEIEVTAPQLTDQDGDGHLSIATGGDDCNDGDPNVFPTNPEKCDDKDNDCNGSTDEGLTRDCTKQGCHGLESCTKGVWGGCSAPTPVSEQCNGQDDDCNGFTDDRASCPTGFGCSSGACQALPDAGTIRPDASTPRPDAGRPDGGCVASGACNSPDGCKSGMLSCADGTTCVNLKVKADGVACPGGACVSGACVPCPANAVCYYGDGCLSGIYNCSSGQPVCSNLAAVPEGTLCQGGWCRNGGCRPIPDAGQPDAAEPGRDASHLQPDAETVRPRDAGQVGRAPPAGCGCQSGPGSGLGVLLLGVGLAALKVRRRP